MKRIAREAAGVLLALLSSGTIAATPPSQLVYDIFDGDRAAGRLDITLTTSGVDLHVEQRAELTLRRMMLTAKIEQTIAEHWQGERLLALRAETSSQMAIAKAQKSLSVVREPTGGLRVTVDQNSHDLPADALPLTIWSGRTLLPGAHFELGDGQLSQVQATPVSDSRETVRYRNDECRRRSFETVAGSQRSFVTVWLAPDDISCQVRIRSGSDVLTYKRRAVP